MRLGTLVTAAVLGLLGLVWLGQGLGFIKGSFMTGQATWAVVGGTLVGLALALVAWTLRGGGQR